MTAANPYVDFLTCNKPSGEDGGDCGTEFKPQFKVTMPSVGIPEIAVTIPDFSGISIEALMKAFELLGLDPCAFEAALAGAIQSFASALEGSIQDHIDALTNLPQQIANNINANAQAALDDMLAPVEPFIALLQDPCEGAIAGINQALTETAALGEQAMSEAGTNPDGTPIFPWPPTP